MHLGENTGKKNHFMILKSPIADYKHFPHIFIGFAISLSLYRLVFLLFVILVDGNLVHAKRAVTEFHSKSLDLLHRYVHQRKTGTQRLFASKHNAVDNGQILIITKCYTHTHTQSIRITVAKSHFTSVKV